MRIVKVVRVCKVESFARIVEIVKVRRDRKNIDCCEGC